MLESDGIVFGIQKCMFHDSFIKCTKNCFSHYRLFPGLYESRITHVFIRSLEKQTYSQDLSKHDGVHKTIMPQFSNLENEYVLLPLNFWIFGILESNKLEILNGNKKNL